MVIPNVIDIVDYTPYTSESEKLLPIRAYDRRTKKEKSLSVKESGPFRIKVENVGEEEIVAFWLYRDVTYPNFCIQTRIKLDEPLGQGQCVVIIPETHNERGAQKAQGYRSFGYNKGAVVLTGVNPGADVPESLSRYEVTLCQHFQKQGAPKQEQKEEKIYFEARVM